MATDLLDPTTRYDELYEVIDDQYTEVPEMSVNSSILASRLASHINRFTDRTLGEAHTDILFKLPLKKVRNRRPDVAFVPYSVWPRTKALPNTNAWDALPAVCVEVVSPTDLAEEVMTKVLEYLESGVRQVWVIYPILQVVLVHESPTQARLFHRNDELTAEAILPGFTMKLGDLIPEPEAE